ncbi:hypothetical protein C4556_00315 [Candidatus Parcubacteria bacterium]|nr:MAG: hypothetical protein C4556_00315 [Candidatus Parcubacteria bacterium]
MLKAGVLLSGVYLAASAYLIATQRLFGESFIAIILGLPWTLALSYFEFFGASGTFAYMLLLTSIALNAFILYKICSLRKAA